MDLVRSVSGTTAMLLLIVCNLLLSVSSRDTHVFSVCREPLVMWADQARYIVYTFFLFSVGVRLLSDLFPSLCPLVCLFLEG